MSWKNILMREFKSRLMESTACERSGINAEVVSFVQSLADSFQNMNPEFSVPMDEIEQEPAIESVIPMEMPVIYSTLQLPPPLEHQSPERMIQWMIGRLTRRVTFCIRKGQFRRCRLNTFRREVMVAAMKLGLEPWLNYKGQCALHDEWYYRYLRVRCRVMMSNAVECEKGGRWMKWFPSAAMS